MNNLAFCKEVTLDSKPVSRRKPSGEFGSISLQMFPCRNGGLASAPVWQLSPQQLARRLTTRPYGRAQPRLWREGGREMAAWQNSRTRNALSVLGEGGERETEQKSWRFCKDGRLVFLSGQPQRITGSQR